MVTEQREYIPSLAQNSQIASMMPRTPTLFGMQPTALWDCSQTIGASMPSDILGADVSQALADAQRRAAQRSTKSVTVDGKPVQIQSPFPSPADWRDCWIYFLMTDRFNNPNQAPKAQWDQKFNFRQGGTFEGICQQLPYLQKLGVGAIWISPVVKNSKPQQTGFEYTYPGYNAQDFLNIDERFASDGTRATAERELAALVDEAHARGIYVVLDIVLNHAGRVFDYVYGGGVTSSFTDAGLLNDTSRPEPPIQWINGLGSPQSNWQDNLPAPANLSPDDGVWPTDLQRKEFFRRRGNKVSDTPGPRGYVPGDFGTMRQLVVEYDAGVPGQEALREKYGPSPVLSILITAYQYLIARYDFDAFRIDTVKYIRPDKVETFGNAIREFALSIGKANFFTFGEIYDSEDEINQFIGRNSGDTEGFGLDAALDFPLFYNLPGVAKASIGVEQIRQVFEKRKAVEKELISSHGEAGRYFVSFLDNHDQNRRFNAPGTPAAQITLGLAVLFALQGIPCVYYGTEQGLQGTNDGAGHATLDSNESVREALWGRKPTAFDTTNSFFTDLQAIAQLRAAEPALRYGRLYFRPVAGNNADFGPSSGAGGVLAFSRILGQREILIVANTNFSKPFSGSILVDYDLHAAGDRYTIQYSNQGTTGSAAVAVNPGRIFDDSGNATSMTIASIPCKLAPMEVQILAS